MNELKLEKREIKLNEMVEKGTWIFHFELQL